MTTGVSTTAAVAEQPATARLVWSTKLLYGVGEISNAVKTAIFGVFTLYFYTSVMGMSGTLVAAASAIGVVWDAIVDPYIGYLSDNLRTRWGRRHALMLLGSLSMGPSFWMFWSPPQNASTPLLFAWLLGTSLLVRSTTSLFIVPYFALGAELSRDYTERTSITGLRGLLALLGTLAATVLALRVFFPDTLPGVDPKLNYASYPRMGLALGLLMTASSLISTVATLRWRSQPTHTTANRFRPRVVAAELREAVGQPSFRALLLSFPLMYLGVVIANTMAVNYLTFYAGITQSKDLATFQTAFYGMGLAGIVVWSLVARVVDKHRLYLVSITALAALMLAAFFLFGAGHVLGRGNVAAFAAGQGLAGFFGSIIWFVPAAMIADTVDADELRTQQRREGLFFGTVSFGQQFATGIGLLLAGIGLDVYAGLQAGQLDQAPATVERIGVLYGLLPAALLVLAFGLALPYRLTRKRVAAIQSALEQRSVEDM